ncbi:MAG: alpha/beta hydrolase [Phycisphaerales bacterium]|nr:alpha/beta hydrolase [Phycisphaerales bacterium]
MPLRAFAASLLALALVCVAAGAQPVRRGAEYLRLIVLDRSGLFETEPLGTLFLASSATQWNPRGQWSMAHVSPAGDAPGGWMFEIPRAAAEAGMEFKFTRGGWETVEVDARGRDLPNRTLPAVDWSAHPAGSGPPVLELSVEGFADQRGTRWPEMTSNPQQPDRTPSVVGELEISRIASAVLGAERTVRVWLPPGYRAGEQASRRYPVLYLNDGQNLFDRATSFIGVEWQVDETLTRLIGEGKAPGTIVVGIDNGGDTRAVDYNPPYTTFQGKTNAADRYMKFVTDELMPWVNARYRTLTGPEHTGFGGSSFGGNVTVFAMMNNPGVFGVALVESPAVLLEGQKITDKLAEFSGPLPGRVFIAVGTRETSRVGGDEAYTQAVRRLADVLRSKGLGDDRLKFVIEQGAEHNEAAWARRLPGAVEFLLRPPFGAPSR